MQQVVGLILANDDEIIKITKIYPLKLPVYGVYENLTELHSIFKHKSRVPGDL